MEAIVFIILHIFLATCAVLKITNITWMFPSFSWRIFSQRNVKTLTPLWTKSADYPTDRSTDHPHRPPPRTTPKIINKDFTYGLSNRLLLLVKFQVLYCANVTDLGFQNLKIMSKSCSWHKKMSKAKRRKVLPFNSWLSLGRVHEPTGEGAEQNGRGKGAQI